MELNKDNIKKIILILAGSVSDAVGSNQLPKGYLHF